MRKTIVSRYLVFLSAITLITLFFLTVHRGYSKLMKPINEAKGSDLGKPIDPNIDFSIIESINNKDELVLLEMTPTPSPQP